MPEPSPVLSVTSDFEVTWRDLDDAQYSWLLDDAHYDRPMPPMAQEIFAAIMWGQGRRTAAINGYGYALNQGPTLPGPELEGRDVFQVWRDEYFPRIKDGCAVIRSRDYASMSAAEITAALPAIFTEVSELHLLTMTVVQPFLAPAMALLEFCDAHLGEDAGMLAATALQETRNETSAAALALGELAELARSSPELAAIVRTGRLDGFETVPGGPEFKQRLHAFLDAYGWRAERWSAIEQPTWAESPRVALMLIARFMDEPASSPTSALLGDGEAKRLAEARIEVRLTPDKLPQFRALIQRCRAHVPMSEERSYCQLLLWGSLRVPVVELGRRLLADGVIDDANDVAYLSTDEAAAGAADATLRLQQAVSERKRQIEAWQKLTPPLHVGKPAAARTLNTAQKLFVKHFRGPDERILQDGRVIRGLAASQGVVTGTARVIRDLQDAERLGPGEVLVCGVTSAPWTPLFAIAGAVVTDAGGILAHSAICAREYGIAAVVGTSVGTRMIPDGALVTVDGTAGTVTIED
jgi:pyruvate,water dikinase